MHPHVTFEPMITQNKTYSYPHSSSHAEQISSSTPFNQNTHNNYHYNYSPSNLSQQKTFQHFTAQQQFYLPTVQQEYQNRPQSSNQSRNQNKYAINSRLVFSNQTQKQTSKFTGETFPNTSKLLNLSKFVEENVKLRKKLLQELQIIKEKKISLKNKTILNQQDEKGKSSTRDTTPKRKSREKASNLYERQRKNIPQSVPIHSPQQHQSEQQQIADLTELKHQKQLQIQNQKQALQQLQSLNPQKLQQIHKLQSDALHQSIHQTPLLREKQQVIEYLSIQIEWLNEKSSQLKKLVNNKAEQDNLFEMYEKMCREVQMLRKENNKKSEKLKKLFEKTNQLTGKQENVNMFLMNLKV